MRTCGLSCMMLISLEIFQRDFRDNKMILKKRFIVIFSPCSEILNNLHVVSKFPILDLVFKMSRGDKSRDMRVAYREKGRA